MVFLGNKTQEKIKTDLKEIIKSKLLNGFKNRKLQPVVKVDDVNVIYEIDEDKSDRDKIVIKSINAQARVWVSLKNNDGMTNNQLQIRVNEVNFLFDDDIKDYKIVGEDKIVIIDMS